MGMGALLALLVSTLKCTPVNKVATGYLSYFGLACTGKAIAGLGGVLCI